MGRLNKTFALRIKEVLNTSGFTSEDFEIEFPDAGDALLTIRFSYKPTEYSLSMRESIESEDVKVEEGHSLLAYGPKTTKTEHRTWINRIAVLRPGEVKNQEQRGLSNLEDVLKVIPDWVKYIRQDLYASVEQPDPLAQLRSKLQSDIDALIDDPNAAFSEDELTKIDQRLDDLLDQLLKLKAAHEIDQRDLNTLRAQFEEFKGSARTYPKGMWGRITSNKLVRGVASMVNSTEGRKLIADQIQKMLGGGA